MTEKNLNPDCRCGRGCFDTRYCIAKEKSLADLARDVFKEHHHSYPKDTPKGPVVLSWIQKRTLIKSGLRFK